MMKTRATSLTRTRHATSLTSNSTSQQPRLDYSIYKEAGGRCTAALSNWSRSFSSSSAAALHRQMMTYFSQNVFQLELKSTKWINNVVSTAATT
jgi:hypothetical protein